MHLLDCEFVNETGNAQRMHAFESTCDGLFDELAEKEGMNETLQSRLQSKTKIKAKSSARNNIAVANEFDDLDAICAMLDDHKSNDLVGALFGRKDESRTVARVGKSIRKRKGGVRGQTSVSDVSDSLSDYSESLCN